MKWFNDLEVVPMARRRLASRPRYAGPVSPLSHRGLNTWGVRHISTHPHRPVFTP